MILWFYDPVISCLSSLGRVPLFHSGDQSLSLSSPPSSRLSQSSQKPAARKSKGRAALPLSPQMQPPQGASHITGSEAFSGMIRNTKGCA